MRGVWKFAALCFVTSGFVGLGGQARAAITSLENPLANTSTNLTYGELSFAITGCTFSTPTASTCGSDNAAVYGISSGRGGTLIGIGATGGYGSSAIYSGSSTNKVNDTLTFTLTVTPLTGSRGVSSVTQTLAGTASSSGLNGDVTSVLSAFTPTGSPGSITVNPGSTTAADTFTLQGVGQSAHFTVTMNMNASTLTTGQTLALNSVALLFNPAPEPGSIALFATGLIGLTTVRRRIGQRVRA